MPQLLRIPRHCQVLRLHTRAKRPPSLPGHARVGRPTLLLSMQSAVRISEKCCDSTCLSFCRQSNGALPEQKSLLRCAFD